MNYAIQIKSRKIIKIEEKKNKSTVVSWK